MTPGESGTLELAAAGRRFLLLDTAAATHFDCIAFSFFFDGYFPADDKIKIKAHLYLLDLR